MRCYMESSTRPNTQNLDNIFTVIKETYERKADHYRLGLKNGEFQSVQDKSLASIDTVIKCMETFKINDNDNQETKDLKMKAISYLNSFKEDFRKKYDKKWNITKLFLHLFRDDPDKKIKRADTLLEGLTLEEFAEPPKEVTTERALQSIRTLTDASKTPYRMAVREGTSKFFVLPRDVVSSTFSEVTDYFDTQIVKKHEISKEAIEAYEGLIKRLENKYLKLNPFYHPFVAYQLYKAKGLLDTMKSSVSSVGVIKELDKSIKKFERSKKKEVAFSDMLRLLDDNIKQMKRCGNDFNQVQKELLKKSLESAKNEFVNYSSMPIRSNTKNEELYKLLLARFEEIFSSFKSFAESSTQTEPMTQYSPASMADSKEFFVRTPEENDTRSTPLTASTENTQGVPYTEPLTPKEESRSPSPGQQPSEGSPPLQENDIHYIMEDERTRSSTPNSLMSEEEVQALIETVGKAGKEKEEEERFEQNLGPLNEAIFNGSTIDASQKSRLLFINLDDLIDHYNEVQNPLWKKAILRRITKDIIGHNELLVDADKKRVSDKFKELLADYKNLSNEYKDENLVKVCELALDKIRPEPQIES